MCVRAAQLLYRWQCVAVCISVSQCIAVCVAVCISVLHHAAPLLVRSSVLECVGVS